ncbi:hypothetical protein ATPR_1028 [Acetobacter tropicalis NBRC 101654]|uniref:Uncharacterized protein n=1 Tax=Acetobacter tropicalis NBRC 101654 TaxID=749388 RepID=F7VCC9_9PROT|nr:hypothetical protein ATPR_1028 [Acetobacter tropicalis NBRC 101654]
MPEHIPLYRSADAQTGFCACHIRQPLQQQAARTQRTNLHQGGICVGKGVPLEGQIINGVGQCGQLQHKQHAGGATQNDGSHQPACGTACQTCGLPVCVLLCAHRENLVTTESAAKDAQHLMN